MSGLFDLSGTVALVTGGNWGLGSGWPKAWPGRAPTFGSGAPTTGKSGRPRNAEGALVQSLGCPGRRLERG